MITRCIDEVLGRANFIANVIWQKKYSPQNDDPGITPRHFFWNSMSPTARTSSIAKISGSRCGAILGMTQREIRKKFDEIVAFAGVEEFFDMPMGQRWRGPQGL